MSWLFTAATNFSNVPAAPGEVDRNVGGSIFIAVTGANVTNRSLFHQAHLQEYMQPGNQAFVNQVNALTSYFGGSGRGQGPGSHGKSRHLSAAQSAGNRDGLSGHLPLALLDGKGDGGVCLSTRVYRHIHFSVGGKFVAVEGWALDVMS
jgi:hypothetical protein